MCELLCIGIKNEPSIKFVTDFWDNPRIWHVELPCGPLHISVMTH
jgi:hypothetical protein